MHAYSSVFAATGLLYSMKICVECLLYKLEIVYIIYERKHLFLS